MKPIMILQPFGIGDVIFTQTLVNSLARGADILWPVREQFVEGLQRAYPYMSFFSEQLVQPHIMETKSKKQEIGGLRVFGVRYAEFLMGRKYVDHMKSKYDLYGVAWETWKEDAVPLRDNDKEKELMMFLGLGEGEKFNLIATKFGSNAHHQINIPLDNSRRNIEMNLIDGFTFFDWCGVIEKATTIHAVSSATLYLFEILTLAAEAVHLYVRKPIEQNFDYVKFLFTKNYILHE